MTRRIEFTVPDEIGEAYDQARGRIPMATWIKWTLGEALESALTGRSSPGKDEGIMGVPQPSSPPAPSRTSVVAKQGVRPVPKAGKR